MFIILQGHIGKDFTDLLLGEPDESQAEEEDLGFQVVPSLFGVLQEGFIFVVLGVFGKKEAGVQDGFHPFFLDGFVFFQGLGKNGRGEKGKINPFIGGVKLPGPFQTPVQIVRPRRILGGLVEVG
jgi:hypothetical protein